MAEERKFGTPTPEQLEKINRLSKKQFKPEDLFVFDAKFIGDGMVPDRFMKLDKALIEGFVEDAKNGDVAYMINHAWATWGPMRGLPNFGRVFDSWLAESNDLPDETVAQYGSIYIVRSDVEKQGTTANQVIADIEAGILFDVSIGFGFRKAECSICGNDIRDWRKCEHLPGREYEGKLCYIIAKPPGDEFEVSSVFAGAYPTASVLSAVMSSDTADQTESLVALEVEDIKRVDAGAKIAMALGKREATLWVPKDAVQKRASFVVTEKLDKEGGEQVAEEVKETAEQTVLQEQIEAAQAVGGEEPTTAVAEWLSIPKKAVIEALGKEMDADTIIRLAKDGLQLRAELIEDTLEWGVRAQGNAFAREFYYEMLSEPGRTIEGIKNLREQFKAQAKEALKTGRATVPMDKAAKVKHVPDEVFKTL